MRKLTSEQEVIDFVKNEYFKENSNSAKNEYMNTAYVISHIEKSVLNELYEKHHWVARNSFSELAYCIKHNIKEQPRCKVCKKPLEFYSPSHKYPEFCSRKCATEYNKNPDKYDTVIQIASEQDLINFINQNCEIKELQDGTKMVNIPLKYKLFMNVDPALVAYVKERWPWVKSIKEAIHCYVNNINEQPKCIQCGNPTVFSGKKADYGYRSFCSDSCVQEYDEITSQDKNKIKKFIKTFYFQNNMTKTNRKLCSEKKMQEAGFIKIMEAVKEAVSFAKDLTEAMYAYYYDITERPVCKRCGKEVRFVDVKNGYKDYCSIQCAKNSKPKLPTPELHTKEDIIDFIKNEYFKPNGSPKDRWRNDHSIHKIIKNENALKELYQEYPWTRESGRFLELAYCVKNNITEPIKCLVCNKIVKYSFGNKKYRTFCSRECSGFYNMYTGLNPEAKIVDVQNKFNEFINFLNTNRGNVIKFNSVDDLEKTLGVSVDTCYKWFKRYNIDVRYSSRSGLELSMEEYLESLNINFQTNVRKVLEGRELDFYIPEHKLAIEMHGKRWHSSEYLKERTANVKDYHYNKFETASEKGITLFQIHDFQWQDPIKQEIWKSRIALHVNHSSIEKIYARKCEIREVDSKTATEFLETCHLEGSIYAKVRLGLYYKGELVSLMTFGKSRFSKNREKEWELYRYASKLYTRVIGGASKLLKYFIKNYMQDGETLISFSNNDYSNGNLYRKLGFQFAGVNESYFYIDQNDRIYNRIKVQKHKLPSLLGISEDELKEKTADEILYEHGIYKIYTSGQSKWILVKASED